MKLTDDTKNLIQYLAVPIFFYLLILTDIPPLLDSDNNPLKIITQHCSML